ncbi:ATP-dependent nuclease [Aestuariivirga sp.]|uniref:ATP-dependent nuclease n=1 Tax=Aestuariivirga sp. TaxID=2650926 RepID=UPI0039E28520
MRIDSFHLKGIRCFEDTGEIRTNPRCNIFVGRNNAGKSTLLKAIHGFQIGSLTQNDIRYGYNGPAYLTADFHAVLQEDITTFGRPNGMNSFRTLTTFRGDPPVEYQGAGTFGMAVGHGTFSNSRPDNLIVPFLSKRKAGSFDHSVTLNTQNAVTGNLATLYSRIDLLATTGHPMHENYLRATRDIVGIPITTKASTGGKEAGFYFGYKFVSLDCMGDGVAELIALIVELCVEKNKIFVLEEPETNLHPSALKSILLMIRDASSNNQFFISTHSNIVVRELGGGDDGKVFRVYRDGDLPTSQSKIEELGTTAVARTSLLRELGYEFSDFDAHDAWLFFEKSSAEQVFRDVLIPFFAPNLLGRLRTYSAGGANNLEPSVSDFKRLIVFINLQPIYKDRLWIRADGDEAGKGAIYEIRKTFADLDDNALNTFSQPQFERFYPSQFSDAANEVLILEDKKQKRQRKAQLLQEVLSWSAANKAEAKTAWETSAAEPIELLRLIQDKLAAQKS